MEADQPGKFIELTRRAVYQENPSENNVTFEYDGSRLSQNFKEILEHHDAPGVSTPTALPVVVTSAYPDVSSFIHLLRDENDNEVNLIDYLYYHYGDHVEVAPTLRLSGSQEMKLWGFKTPVVNFYCSNLTTRPIARIEADGQALALTGNALGSILESDTGCYDRYNYAQAILRPGSTHLHLRWQFAEANPPWHEADVILPQFARTQGLPKGRFHSTGIDLYFQNDGSVVAERSEQYELANSKPAILTTGPSRPLINASPCGTALDRYTDEVTILKDEQPIPDH